EVAVEIRVQPKPRTHWAIVFFRYPGGDRHRPIAVDSPRAVVFNRCFEECIPGEPAPRFELGSNAVVITYHSDQIARPTAAQDGNQLWQQTRRKSLAPDVEINASPPRTD